MPTLRRWYRKADFKYDQQTEKILKNLKEMAEFEGYLTDASDEFKALEKKAYLITWSVTRPLSKDIKEMIAVEIIKTLLLSAWKYHPTVEKMIRT